MADESDKKPPVELPVHTPSGRELAVLQAVHRMSNRIVLVPVYINGAPRFALALLCRDAQGKVFIQPLANLLQPDDVVLDSRGCPGYNKNSLANKNLN